MSGSTVYAEAYRDIDFREHPEKYPIGRGEQGVLIAQPYKDELLPLWKFATPNIAAKSAKAILAKFNEYKDADDFVGMDMARKYLQMGFTRSRRYANHSDGDKYDSDGSVRKQDTGSEQSIKAESARIFHEYYDKARLNEKYIKLREEHRKIYDGEKK